MVEPFLVVAFHRALIYMWWWQSDRHKFRIADNAILACPAFVSSVQSFKRTRFVRLYRQTRQTQKHDNWPFMSRQQLRKAAHFMMPINKGDTYKIHSIMYIHSTHALSRHCHMMTALFVENVKHTKLAKQFMGNDVNN